MNGFLQQELEPYNGTTKVEVTDMYFEQAVDVDYERLSATGTGTLSSPNAGQYSVLEEVTDIIFKERNPELYPDDPVDWSSWYVTPERMVNIPTDVIITKAKPELTVVTSGVSAKAGQEITLTITIENDFDYQAGLPSSEQISISATNATLKDGTSVVQNGNQYTAVYVLTNDVLAQQANFAVNISETAINYESLSQDIVTTVDIFNMADYTKVDEAIAKANALNRDEYKDFTAVDQAIASVVRGLDISRQAEVDTMAQAIEDAIAALEKKEETSVTPTEPTEPTTPGSSGTIDGSTEQGMNSPQTGDNSNTVIWIAVAVLAAGAMTGTVFFARKKKAE